MNKFTENKNNQHMIMDEALSLATEMFDLFCAATTMRQILGLYRNMCDSLNLRPGPLNYFYPKLKSKIRSWKAQALWKKFDIRASHKVYSKGTAGKGTKVLVIGAGPCGLRTAIEAQLMGARVVVVEKRDRISRNNVVHLWPFVITDLRNLGAKKFYGKFCAGSIDHISIRQLQCILLKVALLLGVEVHEGVSFVNVVEPSEGFGWRAAVEPTDHAVSHYEFDVLIGADGKRNTLEGFKRKEFRGKLAIAITANFINKKTEAEARAEEISGVAFIFNQTFFKELYQTTGIDLENIVYYKDETHYFVMTAKKHSLIDKGVILQDYVDPAELLAPSNVNTEKLLNYAREAAEFSTKYQIPDLEFAVNHYGKPDVAMFDFTSMFAAESSSRVLIRKGFKLLQCLVGDSLLEPFWPTGSGCARGFLSSMDAAYMIKLWANPNNSILGILSLRESIYRILAQTTPENLHRDIGAYTVDPVTRYPNLNKTSVTVNQVKHLVDTDDNSVLDLVHLDLNAVSPAEIVFKRKRRTGDTVVLSTVILHWIKTQLRNLELMKDINEISECFTNGKVLCALINRYRPDLIDLSKIEHMSPIECNELAFKILETDLNIPRAMSAEDSLHLENVDSKLWLNYLEQICEVFRGEIPHVKHPKLDIELRRQEQSDFSFLLNRNTRKIKSPFKESETKLIQKRTITNEDKVRRLNLPDDEKIRKTRKHANDLPGQMDVSKRGKKRRSQEKLPNQDKERDFCSLARSSCKGLTSFKERLNAMEHQMTTKNSSTCGKKPKDLLRAIGKIDSSDWQIREIEKKMQQSKKTEVTGKSFENVPKWDKEQFLARQNKISKPENKENEENDERFKTIDETIKNLDKQLKDGSLLDVGERGRNKVACIAGQFAKKEESSDDKTPPAIVKQNINAGELFNKKTATERCHFCKQIVYLMEKISTEGLILHRSCLKCHHCHTNLRLGNYSFDRDDPQGKFYCTQHFKLPAKNNLPPKKPSTKNKILESDENHEKSTGSKGLLQIVKQIDVLDRGETPERIEFENADTMSDGEPSLENIIDENEWTDRNFISDKSLNESDSTSSDDSDDESESYESPHAGSPILETLQLATDWIGKQKYVINSDDSDIEFYDSSEEILDDNEADSQTEGEELAKAREMRRQEVKLLPLPVNLLTDTETEIQSETDTSSSENNVQNSATEISTDSEFDQDPVVYITPKIFIDDSNVKPTKVQVKSIIIAKNAAKGNYPIANSYTTSSIQNKIIENLEFKPLVQLDPSLLNPKRNEQNSQQPNNEYPLNKTLSTEGIASKKSLELKKRYLLGGEDILRNKIVKSGSTSILDSKLKNFHSNISEIQKLLNHPTAERNVDKKYLDSKNLIVSTKNLTNQGDINKSNKNDTNNEIQQINKLQSENLTTSKENENNKPISSIPESSSKLLKPLQLSTIEISESDETVRSCNKKLNSSKEDLVSIKCDKSEDNLQQTDYMEKISSDEKKEITKTDISEKNNDYKETKIEVPNTTLWQDKYLKKSEKCDNLDSDSLTSKSSSSSSINDIPHFILDSTTSPETTNFPRMPYTDNVPRLEVHDSTGVLMELDSLMILDSINGDSKISEDENIKSSQNSNSVTINNSQIDNKPKENTQNIFNKTSDFSKSESMQFDKKIPLRFDSKNQNKIESLKTLPLVKVPSVEEIIDLTKDELPENENNSSQKEVTTKQQSHKVFDSKNQNKIESLKTLPLKNVSPVVTDIIDLTKDELPENENNSSQKESKHQSQKVLEFLKENSISDSEGEITGPILTETELSDWTAEDAVSENFIDIEFVLNSNKNTIKRSKKDAKEQQKYQQIGLSSNNRSQHQQQQRHSNDKHRKNEISTEVTQQSKKKDGSGILQNLTIDEITFADTGSEESCAEGYTATNCALIKNRGYVEFLENDFVTSSSPKFQYETKNNIYDINEANKLKVLETDDNQKYFNVDYVEQGACILEGKFFNKELRTPVNEKSFLSFETKESNKLENDLDKKYSNISPIPLATDNNNLTEESDCLTVVSSPEKSISSKNLKFIKQINSIEDLESEASNFFQDNIKQTPGSDNIDYEYVKKLQQKINQISNIQDCSNTKKNIRKSSLTNHESNALNSSNDVEFIDSDKKIEKKNQENEPNLPNINDINKPSSLSSKLEEITKERTKQKDLIYDLVMGKLQTKRNLHSNKLTNKKKLNLSSSSSEQSSVANSFKYLDTNKNETINTENKIQEKEMLSSKHNENLLNNKCCCNTTGQTSKLNSNYCRCNPPTQLSVHSAQVKMPNRIEDKNQILKYLNLDIKPINYNEVSLDEKLKTRHRKMTTSKSVNDINFSSKLGPSNDEQIGNYKIGVGSSKNTCNCKMKLDFVSDPNLSNARLKSPKDATVKDSPALSSPKEYKDIEKRRSFIKTVSNFFNKNLNKKEKGNCEHLLNSGKYAYDFDDHTCNDNFNGAHQNYPFSNYRKFNDECNSSETSRKYRNSNLYTSLSPEKVEADNQIVNKSHKIEEPPPIPPLPLNYEKSDDESFGKKCEEASKKRLFSKNSRQAELKRIRIAQEIQREQEEIEVQLKEHEIRGVMIEKMLRGETETGNSSENHANDEKLLMDLLEIWRTITQLKKRDESLRIKQEELELEYRHAQLKDQLNLRFACEKTNKTSKDIAAEGAILNEMLDVAAKRAALRSNETS